MVKKKILLTGASGTIGKEIFKELLSRINEYEISLFLRGSPKNKKQFNRFKSKIKIFWGTLQNYEEVKEAVNKQDVVIHVAAALPDIAFKFPKIMIVTGIGCFARIKNGKTNVRCP